MLGFGKKKSEVEPAAGETEAKEGGKGHPTPKRKEAEAANKRPLVPNDRKEARQKARQARLQSQNEARQALITGDEAKLPPQHRGPERRYVRDFIDSRRNVAEYFLIFALVIVLITFLIPFVQPDPAISAQLAIYPNILLWIVLIACIVDGFLIRRSLRKQLTEKFGGVGQGLVWYGVMRAFQLRRWRLPKPKVRHGEKPG